MRKTHRKIRSAFLGQGLIEYAILLALIAIIAAGALAVTGSSTNDVYEDAANLFGTPTLEPPDIYPEDRITIKIIDASAAGIENVLVYMFKDSGAYAGKHTRTDENGLAEFFDMEDGAYRFRADLQAQQFWSNTLVWPLEHFTVIQTGQMDFPVKVIDTAGNGISNVQVYAFTSGGSYVGVGGRTGSDGVVTLDLVDGDYKFRADYQARQIWSGAVNIPGASSAVINTGQHPFPVKVTDAAGNGISNVQVYAFTSGGSYVGVGGRTGSDGVVTLDLVDGDYKFRADYQARQIWSGTVNIPGASSAVITE